MGVTAEVEQNGAHPFGRVPSGMLAAVTPTPALPHKGGGSTEPLRF